MRSSLGEGESATEAIIRAIAATTGREPSSLDPLAYTIDPDSIDEFFCRGPDDNELKVSLLYEGRRIEVTRDSTHVDEILGMEATNSTDYGEWTEPASSALFSFPFPEVQPGGQLQHIAGQDVHLAVEHPMSGGFEERKQAAEAAKEHVRTQFARIGIDSGDIEIEVEES